MILYSQLFTFLDLLRGCQKDRTAPMHLKVHAVVSRLAGKSTNGLDHLFLSNATTNDETGSASLHFLKDVIVHEMNTPF